MCTHIFEISQNIIISNVLILTIAVEYTIHYNNMVKCESCVHVKSFTFCSIYRWLVPFFFFSCFVSMLMHIIFMNKCVEFSVLFDLVAYLLFNNFCFFLFPNTYACMVNRWAIGFHTYAYMVIIQWYFETCFALFSRYKSLQ